MCICRDIGLPPTLENYYCGGFIHEPKINNNTTITLDVVFSRFRVFSFTITLRQKPKRATRMLSLCLVIQRGMRVTPLGL